MYSYLSMSDNYFTIDRNRLINLSDNSIIELPIPFVGCYLAAEYTSTVVLPSL